MSKHPFELARRENEAERALREAERDRVRSPFDLARGERDLLALALREYAAARQKMIDAAWQRYAAPNAGKNTSKAQRERLIFEDHKRHHVQQIDAADRLLSRLSAWREGEQR